MKNLHNLNSETYSLKEFNGYKIRAKVKYKTSTKSHIFDLYTTETNKEKFEDMCLRLENKNTTFMGVEAWSTKEQDDKTSIFIKEYFKEIEENQSSEIPNCYLTELDKIKQLGQCQASMRHQKNVLRVFAHRLGLYDISDHLRDKNEKTFTKKDLILISEYVKAGHQSTPKAKTIDLINEYLENKKR